MMSTGIMQNSCVGIDWRLYSAQKLGSRLRGNDERGAILGWIGWDGLTGFT